jgi:hypothetical protein
MNASFWSFAQMGPYLIAIPYTTNSANTGPYIWANQGSLGVGNSFTQPSNAPGGRVGAVVGQFLMLGDIYQQQQETVGTGNGSATSFSYSLSHTPMLATGNVYDQDGKLTGTFNNGLIQGTGYLSLQSLPGTLYGLFDNYSGGTYVNSVFSIQTANNPGKSAFGTITVNSVTQASSAASYTYSGGVAQWAWTTPFNLGSGVTYAATFTSPSSYATSIIAAAISYPHNQVLYGYVAGAGGTLVTTNLSTVDYETGALSLMCGSAPPNNDQIYAVYTQAAPYRVQWSAIGDPTNWPIPLTANAIAFQSGYEDLEVDLGPVKFIAGYPLYGIIFQEFGLTRCNYVGGNVVWQFAEAFCSNRGLIAKGAAVKVGSLVYFISQDGVFVTDGSSVNPVGTDSANQVGIDGWLAANLNQGALESIRSAYDDNTRCVYFAIPTGTNTLPDTLLTYNPLATKWTRCAIPSEVIWTDSNGSTSPGSTLQLGLIDQNNQYNSMTGPTLNGYLETCDIQMTDGLARFLLGIRPNVASTDTPQVMGGVRNSMQDNITYSSAVPHDPFSRIAPVLLEGMFNRARVSSAAASAFNGVTLYQQPGGGV